MGRTFCMLIVFKVKGIRKEGQSQLRRVSSTWRCFLSWPWRGRRRRLGKSCVFFWAWLKLRFHSSKSLGYPVGPDHETIKSWTGAPEMAEWIKCLLHRPDDLGSIPRSHIKVERKDWLYEVILWCPHSLWQGMPPPNITHTNNNTNFKRVG